MNNESLLDAIGNIDDDLIEEARSPKRGWNWKQWTAIAAAFAILIGSVFIPRISNKNPSPLLSLSVPTFEQGFVGDPSLVDGPDSTFAQRIDLSVSFTAKAVTTLPDIYYFIGSKEKTFHLVQMELIRSLGKDFLVDSFYYVLPDAYLTDLTQYDALVIKQAQQLGYQEHILYNDTTGQLQAMDKVIIGYPSSAIAAFTDGVFDVSLWTSTEYWKTHVFDKCTAPYGQSLEEYEYLHSNTYSHPVSPNINGISPIINRSISDALAYVKPFDNGIFISQIEPYPNRATYRRYTNGYPTNESVSITPYNVFYSKFQFTPEDLNVLPDLASGLKNINTAYDAGEITPPHLKGWEDMQLLEYVIFGWYAKTESGIYGVIRVSWVFDKTDNNVGTYDAYDDQYYIMELGSTSCRSIEPDALIALLDGSTDFILGTNGYSDNGRNPPRYQVFY